MVTQDHSCQALYDLRDLFEGLDHVPIVAKIRTYPKGAVCKKRKLIRYDRRAFHDVAKVQLLAQAVRQLPPIPFGVEPRSCDFKNVFSVAIVTNKSHST